MIRSVMVVLMFSTAVAVAQPARNQVERGNNRQDLRQNRRQIADDKKDTAQVATALKDYDAAMALGDVAKLGAIDQWFAGFVAREIQESRVESAQAQKEVRESKREVRSDRRELGQDVAVGRRPAVVADDARDLNRDKRNLADDRKDAQVERLSRERLEAIQVRLAALAGRFDPPSVQAKRALYVEVVGTQQREVARDRQEAGEDRRETREDRGETREDRRDPLR